MVWRIHYPDHFLKEIDAQKQRQKGPSTQQPVLEPGSHKVWGYIRAPGKGHSHFSDGSINGKQNTENLE